MSRNGAPVAFCCATVLSLCVLLALPRCSHGQDLLTNGDFETGTFAGWTLADQLNPADVGNADHFYLSTPGADTPAVDGITFATAANPAGGNFYAVTASDNPGAHALLQNFTVPTSTYSLTLSFQMFVNDQSGSGPIVDPSGLDYTTGGTFADNQHARVDILQAGATDLSTASADVVASLYLGVDPINFDGSGNLIPNPFTTYTVNLTGVLTPGASYRLRFAEVDNLSSINQGVDNVHLLAVTPEPGVLGLLSALGATTSLGLLRRRRTSACGSIGSRLHRRISQ